MNEEELGEVFEEQRREAMREDREIRERLNRSSDQ